MPLAAERNPAASPQRLGTQESAASGGGHCGGFQALQWKGQVEE
jgi:hypothetical protein